MTTLSNQNFENLLPCWDSKFRPDFPAGNFPVPVPENLSVSTTSTTVLHISWSDASGGLCKTEIERSPDNSTWTLIDTVSEGGTSYDDTSLTPSTEYFYRIRHLYSLSSEYSNYTNSSSGTTFAAPDPTPDPPTEPTTWLNANAIDSGYDLVPIHPRTVASSSLSYFRNAYAGLAWEIPIVIFGGNWPYRFRLLSGPSGMALGKYLGNTETPNSDYGILSWSNPTLGSHSIVVEVLDQSNRQLNLSWTLTVTNDTSRFIFLDNTAGTNGDGSLGSPYNSYNNVLAAGTHGGKTCVFRAGSYDLRHDVITNNYVLGGANPGMKLAYPGETVTLITPGGETNPNGEDAIRGGNADDWGWIGFKCDQITRSRFFDFWNTHRYLFWKMDFSPVTINQSEGSGSNASVIFQRPTSSGINSYAAIIDCTFDGIMDRDMYLCYDTQYGVFERNQGDNIDGANAWGCYLKSASLRYWDIRHNSGRSNNSVLWEGDADPGQGDYVVRYNDWQSDKYCGRPCHDSGTPTYDRHVYRNSWYTTGDEALEVNHGAGLTVTIEYDVIRVASINSSYPDGIDARAFDGTLIKDQILTGTDTLDATTLRLTSGYSAYEGTHGHYIESDVPQEPTNAIEFIDFSAGDLDGPYASGFTFEAASGDISVVAKGDAPYPPNALRMRFYAKPSGQDNFVEQRFDLNTAYTTLWIGYWLYVPDNFFHRYNEPSSENNKLLAVWMDDYSAAGTGPTVVWEFWPDGSGGSRLAVHYSPGGTTAGAHLQNTQWLTIPDDRGKWIRMVHKVVASSSPGANDGTMELWYRFAGDTAWIKHHDVSGADMDPPASPNDGWRRGYLLGWSNSGYTNETDFYIDGLTFSENSLL